MHVKTRRRKTDSTWTKKDKREVLERDVAVVKEMVAELNTTIVESSEPYWGVTKVLGGLTESLEVERAKEFSLGIMKIFSPSGMRDMIARLPSYTTLLSYLRRGGVKREEFLEKARAVTTEMEEERDQHRAEAGPAGNRFLEEHVHEKGG
eukprot:148308-Rhodomonas_salina.1